MAGSGCHHLDYLSWIAYALQLLRRLIELNAIPDTRKAQDRVLATILSRVDHVSDRRVDSTPIRYVARPGDAMFVPYSAIVLRGGYLQSEIS